MSRKQLRKALVRARGQAMLEYSFISHLLLIGGVFVGYPVISMLLNGINKYLESIYWVLTSPIP